MSEKINETRTPETRTPKRLSRLLPVRATASRDVPVDSVAQYLSEIGIHALLTADEEVELAQAIERGEAARARLEADGGGIDRTERVGLERAVRQGDEARRAFINANLRLVVANARRYLGPGIDMLDLIQEGNLGLMRAVEKFDWRKGFKFSTYATFWIRQAMQRARAVQGRSIRIPVQVHETLPVIMEARENLMASLGRAPTIEEVAEESGVDAPLVERALGVSTTVQLETPIGDDGAQLSDFVADDDAAGPDETVEAIVLSEAVRDAVKALPEREAAIISLRFGLVDGRPRSLAEVAVATGLPEHQIPKIVTAALARLSDVLETVEDLAAA